MILTKAPQRLRVRSYGQVVRRNFNIQPILTIRPGFPMGVVVTRDLVLQPYSG